MLEVISWAYQNDFCFDQIMTNGDWWKTEEDLRSTLQKIQDAGYDGKIGLSYDNFHGQDFERIKTFASSVNDIFGEESLNVQAVADPSSTPEQDTKLESELNILAEEYAAEIYILPQTFQAAQMISVLSATLSAVLFNFFEGIIKFNSTDKFPAFKIYPILKVQIFVFYTSKNSIKIRISNG